MDEDPNYTARCNAVTLQSNDRGFFLEWVDQVKQSPEAPSSLPAGDEKACLLACLGAATPVLSNVQSLYRAKSETVSGQKRTEGERALRSAGPTRRVLALHSQAVIRAPPGPYLATALATRSETLLQLNEHEAALADIRLAIREGYHPQLRYELYWRMGRCYRGLGLIPQARVSLQLAQKLLQEAGPTMDTVAASVRIRDELAQLDDLPDIKFADTKAENCPPCVTGGENAEMPSASKLVAIQSNPEVGRHAVATDNIATGDTIVVEPAYASCLLPDKFGTHCHHCFKRLLAPIGCPDCSGVAFCSISCKDMALSTYHRYECHFMDLLIGSGMSILCHLALRIITQSGLKYFLDVRPQLDSSQAPGTYADIYNLVTLADKRSPDDLLHRTLMALFLLRILQSANFFNTAASKDWSQLDEDELYIGSLLLRHLQLLQFNAHEIFETCIEAPEKFRNGRLNYTAVGIYPTVAKFNHDCHPAVARYFVGKSIVLQALRPISSGEEISENYGPVFTKISLASRQRTLASRYWFKCKCQACRENWPTYETLNNESLRLRCSECSHLVPIRGMKKKQLRCTRCKHLLDQLMVDVAQCEKQFEKGMEAMETGDVLLATQLFCSYLDIMYKLGSPPHREMSLCQDALRVCLCNSGNTWIIPS